MPANEARDIVVIYNEPHLTVDHPDWAQEAGVLEAVEAVQCALVAANHRVRTFPIGADERQLFGRLQMLGKTDVVFNLCEGLGGVGRGEAEIAGMLELLGYQLTGSPAECLSLVRNKARTKWLLAGAGLPTAEFCYIAPGEPEPFEQLERLLALGPVIVKPASEDASLGIGPDSVVGDLPALRAQIATVQSRYGSVLVEHFISGREFNAAVVAVPDLHVLPLSEIEFDSAALGGWPIVTYDAKWLVDSAADRGTAPRCPALVAPDLVAEIQRVALAAFRATGCRDFARVDLRVDAQGRVYILEVNGNPDLSPSAGLARALQVSEISYEPFLVKLVENAWRRGANTATPQSPPGKTAQPAAEISMRLLGPEDVPALIEMLERCNVFRPDEVAVGLEVLTEAIRQGPSGDYHVTVAEQSGHPIGWACRGLVPLTDATYDLYWIAVDPRSQASGVGRRLVQHIHHQLYDCGGRWLLAETSASAQYEKTRQFYLHAGFELLSDIPDFYRAGDGRLIFGLRLDRPAQ